MPDIKRKQGYQVSGVTISGYQVYHLNTWNQWDDLALYKSLFRRPNENNIVLRRRIIAAKNYNSTKQGLINWFSDSFDVTTYKVADKKIYLSSYSPLSYMAYNKLKNKTADYYRPRVIIDDVEVIFPEDKIPLDGSTVEVPGQYKYNSEKTEVYKNGITWILWKNIDQTYFSIWETNNVPNELKLKYQYIVDDELFEIEESFTKLTRNEDGEIVEE